MSVPLIQDFIETYKEVKTHLLPKHMSLQSNLEEYLKKSFLLCCVSFYEHRIREILTDFVKEHTHDDRLIEFVTGQFLERQYFRLFNFSEKTKNTNHFWAAFGDSFKNSIIQEIKSNSELKRSIDSFLKMNLERNLLTHENMLDYSLNSTFEEIVTCNEEALKFIQYIEDKFKIA
jgi:hypothetical protein